MTWLPAHCVIVDTETTGLTKEDVVVSLGLVFLEDGKVTTTHYYLLNPGRPIPPEATAIHGITDEQVREQPTWSDRLPELTALLAGTELYIAHNAPFDREMTKGLPAGQWLDTLTLARAVKPGLTSYNNEDLRVSCGLECPTGVAHNALYDAQVTAQLFLHLLPLIPTSLTALSQVLEWLEQESKKPRMLSLCYLPAHKGKKWEEVPTDYLRWVVGKYTGNPNVKFTAAQHLFQRMKAAV